MTPTPLDESSTPSLVERALAAEPEAWKVLVRLYSPMIYQWARNQGLSPADAGSLTEKVFQAAWDSLKNGPESHNQPPFRTWLADFVIATIRSMAAANDKISTPFLHENSSQVQNAHDASEQRDQFVQELFEQLPQRSLSLVQAAVDDTTWKAFWLVASRGQSDESTAESLQLSPATIRQAKYQVLFRLRALLRDH